MDRTSTFKASPIFRCLSKVRAGDRPARTKWRRKVVFDALRRIAAVSKVTRYEGKIPVQPWVTVVFQACSLSPGQQELRDRAKFLEPPSQGWMPTTPPRHTPDFRKHGRVPNNRHIYVKLKGPNNPTERNKQTVHCPIKSMMKSMAGRVSQPASRRDF